MALTVAHCKWQATERGTPVDGDAQGVMQIPSPPEEIVRTPPHPDPQQIGV